MSSSSTSSVEQHASAMEEKETKLGNPLVAKLEEEKVDTLDVSEARLHVYYEAWMLKELAARLTQVKEPHSDVVTHNAMIESFGIHFRVLFDFLTYEMNDLDEADLKNQVGLDRKKKLKSEKDRVNSLTGRKKEAELLKLTKLSERWSGEPGDGDPDVLKKIGEVSQQCGYDDYTPAFFPSGSKWKSKISHATEIEVKSKNGQPARLTLGIIYTRVNQHVAHLNRNRTQNFGEKAVHPDQTWNCIKDELERFFDACYADKWKEEKVGSKALKEQPTVEFQWCEGPVRCDASQTATSSGVRAPTDSARSVHIGATGCSAPVVLSYR